MAEYDKRIPEKLQLLRIALGGKDDLGIFAYYPSTQQTNFAFPSFCLAPATDAPDTMDIQGAIEQRAAAINVLRVMLRILYSSLTI